MSNESERESSIIFETKITCPPILASYIEDLLWTIEGVYCITENYQLNPEHDQTEPSDLLNLTLLTNNPLGEDLVKMLLVSHPKLLKVCDIVGTRQVEPKDWEDNWKQYWHSISVTPQLTLCPSWEAITPETPEGLVIKLDPENAFGTGLHETTQLALKALEKLSDSLHGFSQVNVMDVGTGSGVLAIYAAKKGCRSVTAIDVDSASIQTARKNAMRNDVAPAINFLDTPLGELCLTPYNVIVVNIIAPVILDIFPDLIVRLDQGGHLILTGLLEKNVQAVRQKMNDSGIRNIIESRQQHWVCLAGDKEEL